MSTDFDQGEFDTAVTGWVQDALDQGSDTFGDLLRRLPGVYPPEARRAVTRLGRLLPARFFEAPAIPGDLMENDAPAPAWPKPHPLDFDWRYTRETAESLAERCTALAGEAGKITLLGTPSLVPPIIARRPGAPCTLVDSNPVMIDTLRGSYPSVSAVELDLLTGLAVREGGEMVVVADPPWYPEYVHSFLWAARRLCRPGAWVLLSLPPRGTRPGIEAERAELATFSRALGLRPADWKPAALGYLSPGFERNALRAAGLPGIPTAWRRGDLVTYECVSTGAAPRPAQPSRGEAWDELAAGAVRIKFRRRAEPGFQDPTLLKVVEGDILPTVSRRDPRRIGVDVWTSGNRVFATRGVAILRKVFQGVVAGEDPIPQVEQHLGRRLTLDEAALVRRSAKQAADLSRLEQSDDDAESPARTPGTRPGA